MKKLFRILAILLVVLVYSCEKYDYAYKKTVQDPLVVTATLVDTLSKWPDANLLVHVDFNEFNNNVNSMMYIHIVDMGTNFYYDAKFLMNEDTHGKVDLNCMMYKTLFLIKDTIDINVSIICKDTTYCASTKYYYTN